LLVGRRWAGRSNLIQELLDETHDLERSLHVGPMPGSGHDPEASPRQHGHEVLSIVGNERVPCLPDNERRRAQPGRTLPVQVMEVELRQHGNEGSEVRRILSGFVGGCGSALRKSVRVVEPRETGAPTVEVCDDKAAQSPRLAGGVERTRRRGWCDERGSTRPKPRPGAPAATAAATAPLSE